MRHRPAVAKVFPIRILGPPQGSPPAIESWKPIMTDKTPVPVFDGHNDTLLKLYQSTEPDKEKLFVEGAPANWHIDLPRAKKGGFAGGMFAIFPPPVEKRRRKAADGAVPMPSMIQYAFMWAMLSSISRETAIVRRSIRLDGFWMCVSLVLSG